jgi:nitrite reductase/ring-hydroxylating ferredoxin subunit
VQASAVVVATHAPFTRPTFQLKVSQYRSYAVAGPIAVAGADGLFWDTEDPYHYIRSAVIDGRPHLILGGEDHKTGKPPDGGFDVPFARLDAYAARFQMQPSARWSAQVVESVDGLPFIGQPSHSEPIYVATGFGGNGITFGTLSATIIVASLLGEPNPYAELYRANRFHALSSLGPLLAENVDFPAHRVGDALHVPPSTPPDNLERGQGRILNVRGERLAVYRDPSGQLHALSAVCTHMGCQVAFNPSERSWDCPCHGSRFDIDGAVLDGPATKALARRDI